MSDRRATLRTGELPWIQTTATVIASEFHQAAWGQTERDGGKNLCSFVTKFTYRVRGTLYEGEDRSSQARVLGSKFAVRYDPSNPRYNSVMGPEQATGNGLVSWGLIVLGVLILLYIFLHFDKII